MKAKNSIRALAFGLVVASLSCAAQTNTNTAALTITGNGYVSANYGGGCTSSCTMTTTALKDVMFTATGVPPNWVFDSWSGDCTGSSNVCHLDMTRPHSVTAKFKSTQTFTLTINRPSGGAIFSINDGGNSIQCGGQYNGGRGYTNCSRSFVAGTSLNLGFSPDVGNTRVRWSGDCASAGTNPRCSVTMAGNRTVSAVITP
jgi:hypothetical protein